ncbi:uncharacterized protein CC84DRAFT_1163324 [Paraphaeosphaeria sporulosa]|uniref:Uncharacterized protein n=1 Tax=Paraphaeosphaeria sporulosa TaxID=1460663 RepID=A0A177CJP1_9PLEO|nr:uncharacterized protein CC84DRAFT_1163324 [Paraphaeosphaeria sporulosa]OAG07088.1 hypothetical protein CC84DRAFT_1163324 [Paraphaeosphaeria sporulosa]
MGYHTARDRIGDAPAITGGPFTLSNTPCGPGHVVRVSPRSLMGSTVDTNGDERQSHAMRSKHGEQESGPQACRPSLAHACLRADLPARARPYRSRPRRAFGTSKVQDERENGRMQERAEANAHYVIGCAAVTVLTRGLVGSLSCFGDAAWL